MEFYVKMFTDGSCLGNPGPGGWGVVLQKFEHGSKKFIIEAELSGGEKDSTNNRMEIQAVASGMEFLIFREIRDSHIDIYTDSNLVFSTFTKGWKRKTNQDKWELIDAALRKLVLMGNKVTWNWVKAHAGHPENERCDDLARAQAGNFQ